MQYNEMSAQTRWIESNGFRISTELFLDVIFTEACNRKCPFCIARLQQYFPENRKVWEASLLRAFEQFPVRSVVILGGEATIDAHFWEKLSLVSQTAKSHGADRIILTTNGTMLTDPEFLDRLCRSDVSSVNLSRMHYDQETNDLIFGGRTPTVEEIRNINRHLVSSGKTMRINVNIWRGNLDTPQEMDAFVQRLSGACAAVKFSPLMDTGMFNTLPEVHTYTAQRSIPDSEIRVLYDAWCSGHTVIHRAANVLGYIDYAEVMAGEQRVILKYAQVEDKYDRQTVIPTLKLYPNGCLSNEWNSQKMLPDFPPGLAAEA